MERSKCKFIRITVCLYPDEEKIMSDISKEHSTSIEEELSDLVYNGIEKIKTEMIDI